MRPVASRVGLWMSVSCILMALFTLGSLTFAQTNPASKHKLLKQELNWQTGAGLGLAVPARGIGPLVSTDTWTGGGGSGNTNWSDASNWNNGAITGGENILINLTTAATNEDNNASIGTLTLSNAGDSVNIGANTTLTVGGNIVNNGSITLSSTYYGTHLSIGASLTLSGSGSVVLNGNGADVITGASGAVLTNSSTIEGGGGGNVGAGEIAFSNSSTGVINANESGSTLIVQPGAASTNAGTLEATGGGTLELEGSSWANTGGLITAAAGSEVLLAGTSITGGTLTATATGSSIVGSNVSLTNLTMNGTYDVAANTATTISGTITNNGTINLDSTYYNTFLSLGANTTLTGSGSVILGGNGADIITGAAGTTLTNDETIQGGGGGNVGYGVLAFVNNGTINANVSGTTLIVQPLSTSTNVNNGTMEATGGATLELYGASWTNTGGTITAASGSEVYLDGTSITGGTLSAVGTGVIVGANNSLTGLAMSGTYDVAANTTTNISGTITNTGTINLSSNYYNTFLTVPAGTSTTLTGTGSVVLGGSPNFIDGGTNSSLTIDQSITGAGYIGNGSITTMVNNSTINANISPTVSATPLVVNPGSGGLTNGTNGVLEASNGGTLILFGGTGVITNNGTIEALGADSGGNASTVLLQNGISITGGTLTTTGAGVIDGDGTVYLTNVTNKGTYNIVGNTYTEISGTITNTGTINIDSNYYNTFLYLATNSTLTGSGTVVLGGTANYISGASGTTLTSEQTIEGTGYVGDGVLTLVNKSTMNANVTGATLQLDPGAASTNSGTLEATNGGVLYLYGSSWTNTGTISASGTGSTVELNAVTINGGTITTSSGGVVEGIGTVVLNNVTNKGTYDIAGNTYTEISGTLTNDGTVNVDSNYYNTFLYLNASTKLSGTGSVVLGGTANYISGVSGATLTNSETIEGAGNVGDGVLKIVNSKTIDANVSGTLILQPGVASTNTGTLEATKGGTLELDGGKWTQTGKGTITAATGSTVTLDSVTITGGALAATGTGVFVGSNDALSNVTMSGTYDIAANTATSISGTITNNGTINIASTYYNTYLYLTGNTTLNGTGAVVLTGTQNYISGVSGAVLTNNSTIEGIGNVGASELTITNNGTIEALNGTLSISPGSGGFTNYNGSTNTLTGGTLIANGGNLTFAGSSAGITTLSAAVVEENGGQLIDTNGNINALGSLTNITSTGSLTTDVNFTDSGSFSNAGSLTILKGTTFNVGSLAQIGGNTLTAGTYVLNANLGITGTAVNITTNAANLTLAGGTIENTSSSTNALANLNTNTGTFGLANNANYTTAGNFNNTGTLAIAKGSTFTVTGTLAQISGSTLASGSYVLGGTLEVGSGISLTTNAANLTLEGGTINSGTANALASLASNTGTLAVANSSSFTAGGNFNNSGALDVETGNTFTVTGTNTYTQSAGTTTVDGTLAGNVSVTGGTLLGVGTLKNNVTVGGGGTAPTISAGDAGKAGLLKITGTYTQLSTGTLSATIGSTALGTGYSRLEVTGAASLSGTLTVNMLNDFTPKVGAAFTILSAKSIAGTFSTQYIVISSTEYFAVSYTAKGVVLTVDSGTPPTSQPASTSNAMVAASRDATKRPVNSSLLRNELARNNLRQRTSGEEYARLVSARAYRPESNLDRTYRLPNLNLWSAAARTEGMTKAPVFAFDAPTVHAENNWAAQNPDHLASPRIPVVSRGQQNELQPNRLREPAIKRLLPSLRQR